MDENITSILLDEVNHKYAIVSDGGKLIASRLDSTQKLDYAFSTSTAIKLDQDVNLTVPSPYDTYRKAIDSENYYSIRHICSISTENSLKGYTFIEPDTVNPAFGGVNVLIPTF